MSGVDLNGTRLRKGAGDAIVRFVSDEGGHVPPALREELDRMGRAGSTPLAVARDAQVLGVIELKDVVKEGMAHRFERLRAMGIRTVMVTGDNKLTAAKIAEESGVDDFLAEATPEAKMELIRSQQGEGRLVAMTGDGTNDAPALAQADVGVAMNTGTQAAREAGNMVDLDSNPTKLIEIVEVGKQLLITRGALTTFSIANDVAKYFAILPAVFASTYVAAGATKGPLESLNVMSLGSPHSAIVSAIVFNALIIPLLVPLALRGVRYRPVGRDRAAAPEPAHLRPRRADRAVRRHQADRPRGAQSARSVSGGHKIFLGMAAGVGKTFRMLQEGRAERDEGRDVVIGYLEPHDRAETEQQAAGLPRGPAAPRHVQGRPVRRDGPAGDPRAPARALPDRRARAHQRAGARARQALRWTSPTCSPPGSTCSRR